MDYIGLEIITYEISDGKYNPTLSHIFWGKNLEKCIQIAKSHMISDVFFMSSFLGELKWKDSVLELTNDGKVIGTKNFDNQQELENIMNELNKHAKKS